MALVMHIIPVADERDHDKTADCWCDPSLEITNGSRIFTHNSADMREEFERCTGDALPGKAWLLVELTSPSD
jgi:hypothetical protein